MRTMEKIEKGIINGTLVVIPTDPSDGLLNSMAMRFDHAFGCGLNMSDDEIEKIKKENPIIKGQFYTSKEREGLLRTMRQLHEEVVGTGFYKYE